MASVPSAGWCKRSTYAGVVEQNDLALHRGAMGHSPRPGDPQEVAGWVGVESDSYERQRNALTTAYAECDHAAADAFTAHGVQ